MSRFAPITASLLARKGEASPSASMSSQPTSLARQPWLTPVTNVTSPPPPPPMIGEDKPHRIMVALSAREYETLGIAAVKKGTTRHQIAHAAMDAYFSQLAHEFHDRCRCVSDAAAEGGCCRDD
ncbi:MAG TPA: hypothetical protein VGG48_11525 [Rhizomicrobium sp.]|jgi:hypothetical protein